MDLLCSYTYKQEHSLIFELQDMDLSAFFKLPKRYKYFRSNATFYTAFYGLASAVEHIHNCSLGGEDELAPSIGYHHDIAPRNILVRHDTFLLADFGLAKMKGRYESSVTTFKAGSGDHVAPECMDEEIDRPHVGRAVDIWSLGAIMVDLASYMERGSLGPAEARTRRKEAGPDPRETNTRFFANGCLKDGVSAWMEELETDPSDMTLRTFLTLSRHMLKVRPGDRLDASEVRQNASYIAMKSLFRAALKGIIELYQSSQEQGPDKLWIELWRLTAWGEVMEINGVKLIPDKFIKAMNRADKPEGKLHKNFLKMVGILGTEPFFGDETLDRRPSRTLSQEDLYNEKADKVIKFISEIKRNVPIAYQQDINQRRLELIKEVGDTEVPEIPDEALQPTVGNKSLERIPHRTASRRSVDRVGSLVRDPLVKQSRKSTVLSVAPSEMAKGRQQAAPGSGAREPQEETPVPTIFSPLSTNSNHTDATTPEPADASTSEDYANSDYGLRPLPLRPTPAKRAPSSSDEPLRLPHRTIAPPLTLPQQIMEGGFPEAHGPILEGTGTMADV